MAKTEKKVSIALFDKIVKEHFQNEATIQWHEAEVRVKRTLSLKEMLSFVDEVVGSCFHDELGYMPEVKDFAIKSNILTRYANFSVPDNLEHRYQMVYGTDAVDAVCAVIDTTQLQVIVNSINDKIRFILRQQGESDSGAHQRCSGDHGGDEQQHQRHLWWAFSG